MGTSSGPVEPGMERALAPWGEEMKSPSVDAGLSLELAGPGSQRGGQETGQKAPVLLPSLLGT